MEDFSALHDAANDYVTPYTNFSDEALSSALFLMLSALSAAAFVGSALVPWRAVALVTGWVLVALGHPATQRVVLSTRNQSQLRQHVALLQRTLREWVEHDVVLDEPAELRQVEIFELQKFHAASETWEGWLFGPSPYEPLSRRGRVARARPRGTQFFEEVRPPRGWRWKEKKWRLDLNSREWVEERMMGGVEIETEGERWVYDLSDEEVDGLLLMVPRRVGSVPLGGGGGGGDDDGGDGGRTRRGVWRRRRWTRLVEKQSVGEEDTGGGREDMGD
jgi:hypothetical protein